VKINSAAASDGGSPWLGIGEAQFIGERLILLTPELKEIFKDYFWTNGGHTPPKRS